LLFCGLARLVIIAGGDVAQRDAENKSNRIKGIAPVANVTPRVAEVVIYALLAITADHIQAREELIVGEPENDVLFLQIEPHLEEMRALVKGIHPTDGAV